MAINKTMAKDVILMRFSNQEVILDTLINQRISKDIDQTCTPSIQIPHTCARNLLKNVRKAKIE